MILRKGRGVYRLTKTLSGVELVKFVTVYAEWHSASLVFEGDDNQLLDENGNPYEGGLIYTFKKAKSKSDLRVQMSEIDFGVPLYKEGKIVVWCLKKDIGMFTEKLNSGDYDRSESEAKAKRSKSEIKEDWTWYKVQNRKKTSTRRANKKKIRDGAKSRRKIISNPRCAIGITKSSFRIDARRSEHRILKVGRIRQGLEKTHRKVA